MRDYEKEAANKTRLVLYLLVIVSVVLTFIGGSGYIDVLTYWSTIIITGIITTSIVQVLIQTVTGDFLEKIPLTVEIKGYKFSISLFFILTIALKLIIFR